MKTQYTFFLTPRRTRDVRSFSLFLFPPAPAVQRVSLTLFISLALGRHREHAGTFVMVAIASIGQLADELMSHDGNYCHATQDDVRSFAKRVTIATVVPYVTMNLHLAYDECKI